MNYSKIEWHDIGVTAEIGAFTPETRVPEWHVILHVAPQGMLFMGQLERIYTAEERLITEDGCLGATPIMKRYFLSDATNQVPLMRHEDMVSISFIQQPPLDGSKVAVWIYLQSGTDVTSECQASTDEVPSNVSSQPNVITSHNGYSHIWKMGMTTGQGSSFIQTDRLLCDYESELAKYNATLAANCIRTWFFVRDVDTQYEGMVKARLANFFDQGLTAKTHYIASTGIQGLPADTNALIQLGTYAVIGLKPEQQRYLYALDYLNHTIEYGVTFERGTLIEYGDRAHAWISGTASIDNKGQVVHVGDIKHQTERMWKNVEALLEEADMTMNDCAQIIVYLRDISDYDTVRQMFAERFPLIPTVFTLAPVCRPTWLIEMECVGIAARKNPNFREF